ncbi:MAG TPA: hypothetical protein VN721_07130 [Flavipsychrobacter sp.]|nr:hypothetical protein [Flavipsychrobacter sp.]
MRQDKKMVLKYSPAGSFPFLFLFIGFKLWIFDSLLGSLDTVITN